MAIQKITREEIIHKCVERFRTHGFHSSTMSDLAELCGLQKGSFYHHFASKDEILLEGLRQTNTFFQTEIFSIAFQEEIPPQKRMKSMLQKHSVILLRAHGGCLIANIAAEALTTNPDIKPLLVEVSNNWHQALVHILRNYYSPKEAQNLAWCIIQDMEGAIMLTRLYDDESFVKTALMRSVRYCSEKSVPDRQ